MSQPPVLYKNFYEELAPYLSPKDLRNLTMSAKYFHQHLAEYVKPEQAVLLLKGAIEQGSLATVERLLEEYDFPPSVLTSFLKTAVDNQDLDLVELLLDYGADPNVDEGYLIDVALHYPEPVLLEILMNHGVDWNALPPEAFRHALLHICDDIEWWGLDISECHRDPKVVFLLKHGIRPSEVSDIF